MKDLQNLKITSKWTEADILTNGDVYIDYGDLKIVITQDGRIYDEGARAEGKRIKF